MQNTQQSLIDKTSKVRADAKLPKDRLWSSLSDVCKLLNIKAPAEASVNNEDERFQHLQFRSGQRIHTIGQEFDMLYIVHSGFLKTVMIDEFGNDQVLSFPMKSDLIGVDGIHSKYHTCEVVALSDCDLILIPFKQLTTLSRKYPELEQAIYGVMSLELVREQTIICLLGTLAAEGRVARFLVSLSERFAKMGYSHRIFNLRMTRQEIGSYIGLTLETVSRTLSALDELGLISVDQRTIEIKDLQQLKQIKRIPNSKARKNKQAADTHRVTTA